ncbi:MAG: HAD-IC family P-type ATPase [Clostridiaceae bacterium]|nr:HAD-IC family P-type ATPase [Clostridiaceae bacterium]
MNKFKNFFKKLFKGGKGFDIAAPFLNAEPLPPFEVTPEYAEKGLSEAEVNARTDRLLVNGDLNIKTRSYREILVTNIFTLFNVINVTLAILIFIAEPFMDAIVQCGFVLLIVMNSGSSIVQEIRAKRTIDKLALLTAPKAKVLRDGETKEIALSEVAINDLLILCEAGGQICADAEVVDGIAEVNEALITGEPDAVIKRTGDKLLSGSFLISGSIKATVEHIGNENYAQKISNGAKYIKKTNSEIVRSLRAIIRMMSIVVLPLGIALFFKSYYANHMTPGGSILATAASMISMIPQGLVALTCVMFAVSILKLSRNNTLAQDLYCIETLARVDVLCLDKTGTITEGCMQVNGVLPHSGGTDEEAEAALTAIANALSDNNPTFNAIKERFNGTSPLNVLSVAPFSSERKWSGATFSIAENGNTITYLMGAAEFLLDRETADSLNETVHARSAEGERVIVLAKSDLPLDGYKLPEGVRVIALVLISDKIRKEAPETLRFFARQGVTLKIISGDNPLTVSAIAKKAGLDGAEKYVDATTLDTEEKIKESAEAYTVFGRVTPEQKLSLIKALKAAGHTVAMTGDGVNDVLALKEADCSIAMAAGSDAARTVSQLVLLDSNFASMPKIVKEGRQNVNNLQRMACLYLAKTLYALLLAVLFIIPWVGEYPYEPIHMTFLGSFTIGIPSFLLAFWPNSDRITGRFTDETAARSLPAALAILLSIAIVQLARGALNLTVNEAAAVSLVIMSVISFSVLFRVCLPFNILRMVMFAVLFTAFFLSWWVLTASPIHFLREIITAIDINLAPLSEFTKPMLTLLLPVTAFAAIAYTVFAILIEHYAKRKGFKVLERFRK